MLIQFQIKDCHFSHGEFSKRCIALNINLVDICLISCRAGKFSLPGQMPGYLWCYVSLVTKVPTYLVERRGSTYTVKASCGGKPQIIYPHHYHPDHHFLLLSIINFSLRRTLNLLQSQKQVLCASFCTPRLIRSYFFTIYECFVGAEVAP